jgi:hypothetical protein
MRLATLTLLALAPSAMRAQDLTALHVGDRVRVLIPEAAAQREVPVLRRFSLRGNVTRVNADSLFLSIPGTVGDVGVPRGSIRRLDRSRGVPSRAVSGLGRGLGMAIFSGGLAAMTFDSRSLWGASTREDAAIRGATFGASIGFIHGVFFPTERWRRVR